MNASRVLAAICIVVSLAYFATAPDREKKSADEILRRPMMQTADLAEKLGKAKNEPLKSITPGLYRAIISKDIFIIETLFASTDLHLKDDGTFVATFCLKRNGFTVTSRTVAGSWQQTGATMHFEHQQEWKGFLNGSYLLQPQQNGFELVGSKSEGTFTLVGAATASTI